MLLALFLEASPVAAAVSPPAFDAVTTDAADASSFSFSHTVSGRNTLIVVAVHGDSVGNTASSASYGGNALTEAVSLTHSGGKPYVSIWYLVAPPTGSNTVSVTLTAADKFTIAAISFTGVDQTTPIDGATSAEGTNNPSLPVSSETNDLVLDAMVSIEAASGGVGSGQTQRWNEELGGPGVSGHYGHGSTEAGATTVTMDWTGLDGGNKQWVSAGININNVWEESYREVAHTNVWGTLGNEYDSTYSTAYMYGEGFEASQTYNVGFYDSSASPNLRATDSNLTSTAGGALSSQYLLSSDQTADPGTWHAVAYKAPTTPPTAYTADDPNSVVEDDFEVAADAIPEFPTVLSAVGVAAISFAIYYWMRKRRLTGVPA
ncbi:MAG: hypothetical protein V3U31_07680 [Dehalococcoidia bacterium]